MNKGLKIGLIVGGIAVVSTIGYLVYKKISSANTNIGGNESLPDTRGGKVTDSTCRSNDKARLALREGLYIPSDWAKRFPNQSDCKLLEWMYELKFQTGKSWAGDYDNEKLLETAEWQLHEQNK